MILQVSLVLVLVIIVLIIGRRRRRSVSAGDDAQSPHSGSYVALGSQDRTSETIYLGE